MAHISSLIKSACAAACLTAVATPSFAEVHEVLVYRDGYFPTTLYAASGDTIKFVNKSGYWMRVPTSNSNFLTGWVSSGNSEYYTVPWWGGSFYRPELYNKWNGNAHGGEIVIGTAPSQ